MAFLKESNTRNADNDQREEKSFSCAMQLSTSIVQPMVLHSAIELGVFDILAKAGPGAKLSPSQIVAQMPTKNPDAAMMLDRILKLLVSHSVLGCTVVTDEDFGSFQRLYSLTPVSEYFVTNEDGVSLGPFMALIQGQVLLKSWSQLNDAILEGGIPFNRTYGTHAFKYTNLDPRFNKVFNVAMFNHATLVIKKILESYKGFEQLRQLVDVGGGLGVTINLITTRYPNIKGINFDLTHVIQHAPPYPGVEHVEGDMFENVPEGHAIFMKSILHDWSDEYCLKLLKNCYNAIPNDGKVIVVEAVIPTIPNISTSMKSTYQLDMVMMTQCTGGKERTQEEFVALATMAGFSGIKFECSVCDFWVMKFFK
ncbi:cathecol O-methyltransferase 1 [Quercus suber]|uniref:cathecol O-methyltransferase 1 n=1 Tax=Quercus suber TaxID=58331 RepID=UPI000CE22FA1|nr:caffeic acid 3-O-methyltransferase-like [Quercus suber]POE55731.1 caffeic acid 3-o-methyltransferase [Quercus suber]